MVLTKEIMLFKTQMSLECIMFQETRQAQQDKCHMISLTCGILKRKKNRQVEILKSADY